MCNRLHILVKKINNRGKESSSLIDKKENWLISIAFLFNPCFVKIKVCFSFFAWTNKQLEINDKIPHKSRENESNTKEIAL